MTADDDRPFAFGPFVLEPAKRQVRRGDEPLKLYPKEFDTLLALVERSGELAEKEDLLRRIWPDAIVEEGNLATQVSHLRKVLGGDGSGREYIATVPGRGYQFVAPVTRVDPVPDVARAAAPRKRVSQRPAGVAIVIGAIVIAAIAAAVLLRPRTVSPVFHQLTFRRGTIWSARFGPGGSIVYGAAWDGAPTALFSARPGEPESRPLSVDADILAISPSGELAISEERTVRRLWDSDGRLARLSALGGAPRDVLETVKDAEWGNDGQDLAVVRRIKGHDRIEFPAGHVLYETEGFLACPRLSRTGGVFAFLERNGGDESVRVVDLQGRVTKLASGQNEETGLAWSASGDELFVSVVTSGTTRVEAVTRAGSLRHVAELPGTWKLHAVAPDGRALLSQDHKRGQLFYGDASGERDLSWLDQSTAVDLSGDGRWLLVAEIGAGAGQGRAAYLRRTDGSPAVRLGDGEPRALSPDGRWVIVIQGSAPERLTLLPTGPGDAKPLPNGPLSDYFDVGWLPDGAHVIFGAIAPGSGRRLFMQDVTGGLPQPVPQPGRGPHTIDLADGTYVSRGADGRLMRFGGGSEPRPMAGSEPGDIAMRATPDRRSVFVFRPTSKSLSPVSIYRIEVSTGTRQPWKELRVADLAGLMHAGPEFPGVLISADGAAYAYSYLRVLSDLYIVDGLR